MWIENRDIAAPEATMVYEVRNLAPWLSNSRPGRTPGTRCCRCAAERLVEVRA
jgi:hypothetical protein